jgi:parallel beta-helix repeat protein
MYKGFVGIALLVLTMAPSAQAAFSCPDRSPAQILGVPSGSQKCQDAMVKAGTKYLKALQIALGKCKLKQPTGTCPDQKAQDKIDKAVLKAEEAIAKQCAPDAAQAGLSSAYASRTDDAIISSCMLSQHSVEGRLVSAVSHGASTEVWPGTGKEREKCIKELSKSGTKLLDKVLKNANSCLKKQSKAGTAGDLAPICVGSLSAGDLVAPSDSKTASKQDKAIEKTEGKIAKSCGDPAVNIPTLFACPGAETVADLQDCIRCTALTAMMAVVENQHSENGQFVHVGLAVGTTGALQVGINSGTAGTKLLVESGDYQEEAVVPPGSDGMAIVGCGAHKDERPRVIPPAPQTTGRGIQAAGVDGLLFQSLDFFDQDSDHIFVAQAQGVSFRDITGDGNLNTRYAVFPVASNDVLVELCDVLRQDDAPIYVGQSTNIVVRYNDIREGVAGIEIENCGNAHVFGNNSSLNTGGILVFKDPGLVNVSDCHAVHHNVMDSNNEPNFGSGTVGVIPAGSGLLIVANDSSTFNNNMIRDNDSFGIAMIDEFLFAQVGGDPISPDPTVDDNYIFDNWISDNGTNPGAILAVVTGGAGSNLIFRAFPPPGGGSSGNCRSGNFRVDEDGNAVPVPKPGVDPCVMSPADPDQCPPFRPIENPSLDLAPNLGDCTLPPPNPFPGCPVAPAL